MKQDIFEDMSTEIGCEYISDLSLYKDQVEKKLLKISLEEYSEKLEGKLLSEVNPVLF